jgi:hypothetical protein
MTRAQLFLGIGIAIALTAGGVHWANARTTPFALGRTPSATNTCFSASFTGIVTNNCASTEIYTLPLTFDFAQGSSISTLWGARSPSTATRCRLITQAVDTSGFTATAFTAVSTLNAWTTVLNGPIAAQTMTLLDCDIASAASVSTVIHQH